MKTKAWRYIVSARNCLLKIMSLRAIILRKTDFAIFAVYRVSLAEPCALLINIFEKRHLINSESNLRPPQHLNRSFLLHQLMPLTTVTRRSIIDVEGVLDTPLKLVTIKSFKRDNRKIMSKATKIK